MVATNDSQNLFTTDKAGNMKQFSVKKKELVSNYGKPYKGNSFSVMAVADSKNIFTWDAKGSLIQWSIGNGSSFEYGVLNKGGICS